MMKYATLQGAGLSGNFKVVGISTLEEQDMHLRGKLKCTCSLVKFLLALLYTGKYC